MTVLYTPQIGKDFVYEVTDQRGIRFVVDLSDEDQGPTCSCLRVQVRTADTHTQPPTPSIHIIYTLNHSSIDPRTHAKHKQQRQLPCMHALAVFVHRQQTRGETYDLPEAYASPVALISPLYALPTLAQQYAAVPLLPAIPPFKKDATIFPPLAAVEVVAKEAGGGKNRAAAGAVERTCSVEEAHRLGAPLTEAGKEFLAAQAEEGQGEGEREDDGDEGGHDEGGASSDGEAEHEGDGGESARRLRRLDVVASFLRENLVDGQLSYKSVVEGSSGLNQALFTWLLPLLRRRGVIVMEETRDDYIIRPGPRFGDVLESDGDESEEEEAEIAEQQQVVREHRQEEARLEVRQRQRQRRPQEGQEGGGAKRRRAWGTSCSYCHAKKIKCGRHRKCLNNRVEAGEGGSAAADGGQETGDDECEEEGATAAPAGDEEGAAAGDENEEQQEEKEAPPHTMWEGPRRPLVWGLRPDEGMAFAAVIPGRAPPPPPPERLRRVGGKRMGPPKRNRIPNAGSQPSQLSQSQASQG